MEKKILVIINNIRHKKDLEEIITLDRNMSLRRDLGFDSFDLAELTVLIEDEFDVDIFEDDIIDKVDEIISKICGRDNG